MHSQVTRCPPAALVLLNALKKIAFSRVCRRFASPSHAHRDGGTRASGGCVCAQRLQQGGGICKVFVCRIERRSSTSWSSSGFAREPIASARCFKLGEHGLIRGQRLPVLVAQLTVPVTGEPLGGSGRTAISPFQTAWRTCRGMSRLDDVAETLWVMMRELTDEVIRSDRNINTASQEARATCALVHEEASYKLPAHES